MGKRGEVLKVNKITIVGEFMHFKISYIIATKLVYNRKC
ncbi:hypothetical protein EXM36_09730 [Clostridium botulinum]|uniref:Uncharacterized protein n=1 Tax=Clostridium botulinum (strain Hall / ATCC 3502 / NCTC 13319 / Type A) TaxID=441771 RepID=A5HZY9_CLOBH|nr:hypothetical protein CLB_0838 [Clostridium botulinum A str. ATCC 19397]ABS37784.1 hypothetical protein CLC_0852 [Clostridium botulinum A str. Hall]AUM86961.1 hypothetical protein RSJ15_04395 [Clostridium botulinum]EDT82730.1 hypothetical protein CBN_0863 [Clostridium botulinum NCTC 2916]CAL82350.1 hypothetical protein CBO0796 [Clostridium botulinum A str. ATCC 3502]CBZ02667.1 hypothetical protein H04402_00855 [Clostridium botulinum H04402 065]